MEDVINLIYVNGNEILSIVKLILYIIFFEGIFTLLAAIVKGVKR